MVKGKKGESEEIGNRVGGVINVTQGRRDRRG